MKPNCATCKHHSKHKDVAGEFTKNWCWLYRKWVFEACGNYDDHEPGSEG